MADKNQVIKLALAIRQVESGGNYQAKGGSGEYGAYQYMPATWKSTAKQYLGDENAEMTIRNQNIATAKKLNDLLDRGYSPEQVASIWNSGQPTWEGKVGVNKYGQKYNVPAYVNKVMTQYSNQDNKISMASTQPQKETKSITQAIDDARGMGWTDTQILEHIQKIYPTRASDIQQMRQKASTTGKSDREVVNFLSLKATGKMPQKASVPIKQELSQPTKTPYVSQIPETGWWKPQPIQKPSILSSPFEALTGVRVRDVVRDATNVAAAPEIGLGASIGDAIASAFYGKKIDKATQGLINSANTLITEAQKETNPERKQKLLDMAKQDIERAGGNWEEIIPSIQKTTKQIVGEGIGTAIDVATAGTYGLAKEGVKSFQLATKSPTVLKMLTGISQKLPEKVALKTFGAGARATATGLGIGYGMDVATGLQYGEENPFMPGMGTAIGGTIPAAAASLEFLNAIKRMRSGQLSEAIEDYKTVFRPTKSNLKKIEIKQGKDIDDVMLTLGEERVVPKLDRSGKLDVASEVDRLQDVKYRVDSTLANSLDDTIYRNDLNDIRNKAKARISDKNSPSFELNAKIAREKMDNIDRLIDEEIERYGRTSVSDKELHNIKNGMWTVGFDINNRTLSPAARNVGNIAKNTIQDNNPNLAIQQLNELSGRYADAVSFLEDAHGRTAASGKVGGWFAQLMGSYIFDKILGNIPGINLISRPIGAFIGRNYNAFINDPERIINAAIRKLRRAGVNSKTEKLLQEFEAGLLEAKRAGQDIRQLFLP